MTDRSVEVSVITTLCNYARYVGDCIESFQKQDFLESEMVIVDDASNDNPYDVIGPYASQDSRIKYIRIDENQGYSHAKNVGIRNSLGGYLVMLDADDMLTIGSLQLRYQALQEHCDLVHGPVYDFNPDGSLIRSKLWKQWKKNREQPNAYKYIHAQGVMLKKDIHRKIGLYDESLWSKSDREMWARIFHHNFNICTVDREVAIYRLHKNQMHKSKEKLKHNDKLQQEVLKKIEKRKTNLNNVRFLE